MWPKILDKSSKNNRRIGDWMHDEIPMQATLQNNYYKARNVSNYLISDVSGYNNDIFYRNDLNKIASETKHKYRKLIDQKILKRQILKTTT